MKLCETCRYGSEYELDKPCVVYREDCPLYQKVGDGMTNEKAIEELKAIKSEYSNKAFEDSRLMRSEIEALDMAIKALEQEPSGDAISRQAVIEAFKPRGIAEDVWQECREYKVLKSLPSVNPQEPKTIRGLHLSQQFKDWLFIKGQKADVLDKIRAEIKALSNANPSYWHSGDMVEREEVFDILDKYKAERDHKCHTCKHYTSGEQDGSCDSYICKGYSDWESEDEE